MKKPALLKPLIVLALLGASAFVGIKRWGSGGGARPIQQASVASQDATVEATDWQPTLPLAASRDTAAAEPGTTSRALFRTAGPTVGRPLAPASPEFVRAQLEGRKSKGRVTILDRGSFAALSSVAQGERVLLPLAEGKTVAGIVELIQNDGGTLRVAGTLADGQSGSFFLNLKSDLVSGLIQRVPEGLAYRIEQRETGEIALHEMLRSDVVCAPLPRMQNEPKRAVAAPSDSPQQAPPILNSRSDTVVAQLYLDFDGETVTDPAWNGGNTIVAAAYSLSNAEITDIFNRVREDFWPFNINVTTDVAKYNAAPVGKRMRCIITPTNTAAPGSGGVAYLNCFAQAGGTFSSTIPCWVFNSSVVGISEAISHELGHTFGLGHDGREIPGTGHEEYFLGHGSGATSWCPLMGASYYVSVSQWSKGEYQYANNVQDDVAIIANTTNGFGFVSDEAGNTLAAAVPLNAPGGNVNQSGVIRTDGDSDFFAFTTTGGTVTINAAGASPTPNLDIALEIQNAAGVVQAANNPAAALNAGITTSLAAGTYYVKVSGSGAADPLTSGYTSYGSIGAYTLTGTVPGGVAGGAPNLTPAQPAGWSNKLVISNVTGTNTDSTGLEATDTLYLDFAVLNNGTLPTATQFATEVYVDNVLAATFQHAPPLAVDAFSTVTDYALGTLTTGTHTIRVKVDAAGAIAEGDETDNEFTRTITVGTSPNLAPYQPGGWSDRIVISKVTGTTTDGTGLLASDTLYMDFAVANFGTAAATEQFSMQVFVDGVLFVIFSNSPPLAASTYTYVADYSLGTLAAGIHTVRIKVDSANAVAESDETDNEYTKTFPVGGAVPANDSFSNAQVLTGSSGTATGTNINATKEAGEPNHAGDAGGGSIWFQWTAPASGVATIDTLTSNYDTLLATYTGSAVGSLTAVPGGSNDDDFESGTRQSKVTFNAVAGTVYRIVVDGWDGETGSVTLHYSLTAVPTVVSLNRANSTPTNAATVNWALTFSSAVTGVTAGNFSLSGAAATGASVGTPTTADGGVTWNVPVTTGSGDGTLTLSLANTTGQSPSTSTTLPFVGASYTIDKTPPTVAVTPTGTTTTSSPITFTLAFSESVTGLTTGGLTVTNGTVGTLSGSGTSYTIPVTPTSSGVVTCQVNAGAAQDAAGNNNAASNTASVTKLTPQEAWRQTYFGTTANTGNAADTADPDGDGGNNLFEYVAGLVPTDPLSRFNVRVEAVAGQPTQKAIIFSPLVAGRTYVVKSKASLSDSTWTALTSFTTSNNGAERTVTDLAAGTGPKFYQVEITLP